MRFRRTLLLTFLTALALSHPAAPATIALGPDETVVLDGWIASGDAEKLRTLLGRAKRPRLLIVDSPGGLSNEAITMGRLIVDAGLDLRVERICASSCANYLFTVARRKTVTKESVVCYHGGIDRTSAELRESLARSLATDSEIAKTVDFDGSLDSWADAVASEERSDLDRQRRLLATVGVDEALFYPGMVRIPRFARPVHEAYDSWIRRQEILWCPPPEVIEQYGVHQTEMWYPTSEAELLALGHRIAPDLVLSGTRISDPEPDAGTGPRRDPPAMATQVGAVDVAYLLTIHARGHLRDKAYPAAIKDLDAAIDLAPVADLYIARGTAYLATDQPDAAIEDFTRALELDPDSSAALSRRGATYVFAHFQIDEALPDLDKAIRLGPEPGAYFARAIVRSVHPNDDYAGSIADLDEAIRLMPNHWGALELRGRLYALKGDNERSRKDLAEAARLKPTFPGAPQ